MTAELDPDRLGARGQIYVTARATTQYAEARQLRTEEARRELTEYLLDARIQHEGPPMQVRARSHSTQVAITAQVVREGRLLVVVSAHARDYL